MRGGRRLHRLLLAEGLREDQRLRALVGTAEASSLSVARVARADLDARTNFANHQGVALEAGPFPYASLDSALGEPGTVLILDHLQDPQNVGTLLRAAEATGVKAIVIPQDRAVGITPAVVNTSSGAVEHLAVAKVPNISRAIERLKKGGWWIAGLDVGPDALDLFTVDLPTPVALVVGAEGDGISLNARRHCDLILSIPMVGQVASLNAATAGSIALFDVLRRQRIAVTTSESASS